ncbi:hypothetical protein [Mycolicibacterium confluentis]|nr:hypothetical protein [Mycolicibacterium confluentis]MCV7322331.1 hypothetical protein [Mycolicibacterium confluentis]ORV28351.1 hypothetical protein AWB99_17585 [Mycolicibacterium confluentis]
MNDKRRAHRAKQARRDVRRARRRDQESLADPTLTDAIRSALAKHPADLLSAASLLIDAATPERFPWPTPSGRATPSLDNVLNALCGARSRETTALLAVIAELLADDPEPQLRCRREVAQRGDHLPRWIRALPQAEAYRAVRRTHVLGDVDELVLGVRLGGGHELTVSVLIDHLLLSGVADAGVVPEPIDEALARVVETSTDTEVVEMNLADARAWIEEALARPTFAPKTETWPLYRALVQWVVSRLPEGGARRSPAMGWVAAEELCTDFFASGLAAPFTASDHREVLWELFETGSGDPVRWSAARVEQALGGIRYGGDFTPLEVALDVPDLLRAFIPYAHAQSGIHDEFTSQAIAAIDELRLGYRRKVLRQANNWEFGDAV